MRLAGWFESSPTAWSPLRHYPTQPDTNQYGYLEVTRRKNPPWQRYNKDFVPYAPKLLAEILLLKDRIIPTFAETETTKEKYFRPNQTNLDI